MRKRERGEARKERRKMGEEMLGRGTERKKTKINMKCK